jgi:hypothetical protein
MNTPQPQMILGDRPAPRTSGATRPVTVTIAAALLVVLAILETVDLAISFSLRDVLGDQGIQRQLSEGPTSISPAGVGLVVLMSVVFLVLARFVLRGSNLARIVAGLFSCLCLVAFFVAAMSATPMSATPMSATPATPGAEPQLEPQWYLNYSAPATLLTLASYVAIIVLLALRPSDRYFTKRSV